MGGIGALQRFVSLIANRPRRIDYAKKVSDIITRPWLSSDTLCPIKSIHAAAAGLNGDPERRLLSDCFCERAYCYSKEIFWACTST